MISIGWVVAYYLFDRIYALPPATAGFADHNPLMMVSDVLFWVLLVAISLAANRRYLLVAAGLQAFVVMVHLGTQTSIELAPLAYAIMDIAGTRMVLIAIWAGCLAHLRRRRSDWQVPDWRWQLRRPSSPSASLPNPA